MRPRNNNKAQGYKAQSAHRLNNYLSASFELMEFLARAHRHDRLGVCTLDYLTTWKKDIAELAGVAYADLS